MNPLSSPVIPAGSLFSPVTLTLSPGNRLLTALQTDMSPPPPVVTHEVQMTSSFFLIRKFPGSVEDACPCALNT